MAQSQKPKKSTQRASPSPSPEPVGAPTSAPAAWDHTARIAEALKADIPKIYANAFVCAMGVSDVTVILERNGRPEAVLNLSFTSTKTLSVKLAGVVAQLEEKSGQPVMITDDVEKYFAKARETQ
jgi:hypothetical protein